MNKTVATSAMPMGMPGWPDLAASTASMARARMALAMSAWVTPVCGLAFAAPVAMAPRWLLGRYRQSRRSISRRCAPRLPGSARRMGAGSEPAATPTTFRQLADAKRPQAAADARPRRRDGLGLAAQGKAAALCPGMASFSPDAAADQPAWSPGVAQNEAAADRRFRSCQPWRSPVLAARRHRV